VLVGLDLGAARARAVAIDRRGAVLEVAERELGDDPLAAAEDVLDQCGAHHCDGIGLAGIKDALLERLTGERATDVVTASASPDFDVAARAWRESAEPRAFESPAPAGRLGRVPVAAGAAAEAAAALGAGVLGPGDGISLRLGNDAVVVAALDHPAPGAACHALPGAWCEVAPVPRAGAWLRWLRDLVAPAVSFRRLIADAAACEPGGLRFAPTGDIAGLDVGHDRAALTRALLDGVALALRELLPPGDAAIRVTGNGARSDEYLTLLATELGRPLERCAALEGAAYGAALLGGVAAGVWMDVPEAVATCVGVERVFEPH
jgi:xylulokinase